MLSIVGVGAGRPVGDGLKDRLRGGAGAAPDGAPTGAPALGLTGGSAGGSAGELAGCVRSDSGCVGWGWGPAFCSPDCIATWNGLSASVFAWVIGAAIRDSWLSRTARISRPISSL